MPLGRLFWACDLLGGRFPRVILIGLGRFAIPGSATRRAVHPREQKPALPFEVTQLARTVTELTRLFHSVAFVPGPTRWLALTHIVPGFRLSPGTLLAAENGPARKRERVKITRSSPPQIAKVWWFKPWGSPRGFLLGGCRWSLFRIGRSERGSSHKSPKDVQPAQARSESFLLRNELDGRLRSGADACCTVINRRCSPNFRGLDGRSDGAEDRVRT